MGGHHNREQRRRREHPPAPLRPTVVTLTPEEIELVTRPIAGLGGHQGLLLRLVPRVARSTGRLELSWEDIMRVRTYAASYGNGGFQDRFRAIVSALERAEDARGNR